MRSLLTASSSEQFGCLSLHDRVQIALAIADPTLLQSLLSDCIPSIAYPDRIGNVSTTVGIPLEGQQAVDAVLRYEEIYCVLAESPHELEQHVAAYTHRNGNHRGHLDLTRCETETRTLGQALTLAQSLALLAQAGFTSQQVQEILHLPQDGWHKSWWFAADAAGRFTVPFLRVIRIIRYADGTYTFQYKDFFAQDKPVCFKSLEQQVVIEISADPIHFPTVLQKINYTRHHLGLTKALLICDRISPLAAQGLISQGISIYASNDITLPVHSDCTLCVNSTCPMHGKQDSPVVSCQSFCLDSTLE